ncbi:MAG: site-2 protease family protein [Candidatus Methanoperedens sp.]|nr:site-2 protease family protein [Candidatus Methanoperedens sp.]
MDRNSLREIVHLVASLLVLTIAFSYPGTSIEALAIAAVGVGTGFLLHELAHKFTAQRYGYVADYEASPMGLLMAIGLSVFTGGNFVFAAPGAVMIRGKKVFYSPYEPYTNMEQTEKELAYISVSGAVVNLVLATIFYISSNFVSAPIVYSVLQTAAFINVFLAGFNMIPFGPLDGAKVWRYNRMLWGIMMFVTIILFLKINRFF